MEKGGFWSDGSGLIRNSKPDKAVINLIKIYEDKRFSVEEAFGPDR